MVTCGGAQHVIDFAPLFGQQDTIQWAAIYNDCSCELKPIHKGYRTTLTFKIYPEKNLREVSDYMVTKMPLVNLMNGDRYYPRVQVCDPICSYFLSRV